MGKITDRTIFSNGFTPVNMDLVKPDEIIREWHFAVDKPVPEGLAMLHLFQLIDSKRPVSIRYLEAAWKKHKRTIKAFLTKNGVEFTGEMDEKKRRKLVFLSTPVDTPVDTPVNTPGNPQENQQDEPVDTPVDTPVNTPVDTPKYQTQTTDSDTNSLSYDKLGVHFSQPNEKKWPKWVTEELWPSLDRVAEKWLKKPTPGELQAVKVAAAKKLSYKVWQEGIFQEALTDYIGTQLENGTDPKYWTGLQYIFSTRGNGGIPKWQTWHGMRPQKSKGDIERDKFLEDVRDGKI